MKKGRNTLRRLRFFSYSFSPCVERTHKLNTLLEIPFQWYSGAYFKVFPICQSGCLAICQPVLLPIHLELWWLSLSVYLIICAQAYLCFCVFISLLLPISPSSSLSLCLIITVQLCVAAVGELVWCDLLRGVSGAGAAQSVGLHTKTRQPCKIFKHVSDDEDLILRPLEWQTDSASLKGKGYISINIEKI